MEHSTASIWHFAMSEFSLQSQANVSPVVMKWVAENFTAYHYSNLG
jgi:hypothetical protein